MLKIGVTGGIGTGKSTVCKIFETLGVPVYYADDRAKWILHHDDEVIAAIKKQFGESIYLPNGTLDRVLLGKVVFNDKEKLEVLNSIVHPAVFKDGFQWEQEQEQKGVYYTLKEAALLFESGSYKFLDKIIVVTAPENIRIERVMKRDNLTKEEVLARINKQMPEQEKINMADFVINNDGEKMLIPQIMKIHNEILAQ